MCEGLFKDHPLADEKGNDIVDLMAHYFPQNVRAK